MRFTLSFLSIAALAVIVSAVDVQLQNSNGAFLGCLAASSKTIGAPVVIHDCNTGDLSNYDWVVAAAPFSPSPQQIVLSGTNLCLDVKDGVNNDGTKLQLWTCTAGNTNQLFSQTNSIGNWQWVGTNKCLDLTGGAFTNDNPIQVWTCDASNLNQRFSSNIISNPQNPTVKFQAGSDSSPPPRLCLAAAQNTDGARVSLAPCNSVNSVFPLGNATWVIPRANANGLISTYNGAKCLDLRNGDVTNGNLIQMWTCDAANTNQIFSLQGNRILRAGNKCVDVQNGNFVSGANIQIWDCDAFGTSVNQRFVAA